MIKRFGGAMVISIWLISGQPGFAQDSKLIAEAKKEGGKVVVYSSMETSIAESVGNAFKNKTGIEMEFWRASSTKVMDRALNEHRAGRPLADVVVTIADPMLIMQREGVFAKYDSPAAAATRAGHLLLFRRDRDRQRNSHKRRYDPIAPDLWEKARRAGSFHSNRVQLCCRILR